VPAAEPAEARPPRDLADEAMLARAHERFAGERRRSHPPGRGKLPNLILIGGLKCGTTSLHHYLNLHPEIAMSRPKELNFFVAELNWDLGQDWYAAHFDRDEPVRGETSPHYTARPRLDGVARRMRELIPNARLVYAVRDPIARLLSHYVHNVGGGYESRSLEAVLADKRSAYADRSRYAYQLEPYLESFGRDAIAIVTQDELRENRTGTMRSLFEFLGVDSGFTSPEFRREWETGSAKSSGGFRLMDRAVRLPGLRALDRNFDRLPERLRWRVERLVHDPDAGEGSKPELAPEARRRLEELFRPDVERLEEIAGRRFGWLDEGA
jgi:sulfotransferase family protein